MPRLYRWGEVGVVCPLAGFVLLVATWTAGGCRPGGLSDTEQRKFRRELRANYEEEPAAAQPEPEPPQAQRDAAAEAGPGVEPESDSGAGETSEGGPGTLPEPEASGAPIHDCVAEIFQSRCSGLGCHAGGQINSRPDLDQGDLFNYLTTTGPMACSEVSANYVDLDDPAASFMRQKLLGEQPAGCGTNMPPPGATDLTPTQLECLEAWFASL
jgi:hypothetical protein